MTGKPLAKDLDTMVDQYNSGSPVTHPIVSVFPRDGTYRNTSRYPSAWKELPRSAKTLTATASGDTVTLAGTVSGTTKQNLGLIVHTETGSQVFSYRVLSTDTLTTAAAALAALVSAFTPASAAGAVITIPAAVSLVARVGIIGQVGRELRRQRQVVDIDVWVPDQSLRSTIGKPIRDAFAQFDRFVLADGFYAQLHCLGDYWLDDPEKAGLYRRCIAFDIDYPTTETRDAAEIVAFEAAAHGGQDPTTAPLITTSI